MRFKHVSIISGSNKVTNSLALRNHDWLQNFVQFVLNQVGYVAGARVVVLEHVQVQLKLFWDGVDCSNRAF